MCLTQDQCLYKQSICFSLGVVLAETTRYIYLVPPPPSCVLTFHSPSVPFVAFQREVTLHYLKIGPQKSKSLIVVTQSSLFRYWLEEIVSWICRISTSRRGKPGLGEHCCEGHDILLMPPCHLDLEKQIKDQRPSRVRFSVWF